MSADRALDAEGPSEVGFEVAREVAVGGDHFADDAQARHDLHERADGHVERVVEQRERPVAADNATRLRDPGRHDVDVEAAAKLMRDDRLRKQGGTVVEVARVPPVDTHAHSGGDGQRARLLDHSVFHRALIRLQRALTHQRNFQITERHVRESQSDIRAAVESEKGMDAVAVDRLVEPMAETHFPGVCVGHVRRRKREQDVADRNWLHRRVLIRGLSKQAGRHEDQETRNRNLSHSEHLAESNRGRAPSARRSGTVRPAACDRR